MLQDEYDKLGYVSKNKEHDSPRLDCGHKWSNGSFSPHRRCLTSFRRFLQMTNIVKIKFQTLNYVFNMKYFFKNNKTSKKVNFKMTLSDYKFYNNLHQSIRNVVYQQAGEKWSLIYTSSTRMAVFQRLKRSHKMFTSTFNRIKTVLITRKRGTSRRLPWTPFWSFYNSTITKYGQRSEFSIVSFLINFFFYERLRLNSSRGRLSWLTSTPVKARPTTMLRRRTSCRPTRARATPTRTRRPTSTTGSLSRALSTFTRYLSFPTCLPSMLTLFLNVARTQSGAVPAVRAHVPRDGVQQSRVRGGKVYGEVCTWSRRLLPRRSQKDFHHNKEGTHEG